MLTTEQIIQFQSKIYGFYDKNSRDFAWRKDITPYKIVVSEIMLQQTQTTRVVSKFEQWMQQFSSFDTLANASVEKILQCWHGLGYNRRALFLYAFAKRIVKEYDGIVPQEAAVLQTFKGVGKNTASSICAFAFNMPVVFIETNIRTVFIHEFFKDQKNIDDKQLLPLIAITVDHEKPRDWYYALMDYGVYLKRTLKTSNSMSKHYKKQSKFQGSRRQLRGAIISLLIRYQKLSLRQLIDLLQQDDGLCLKYDIESILGSLYQEGFLCYHDNVIELV
ncbi:A/G-specific adenine glycosylase [Candidatus Dependentiae bacterium]|nr:A/G-specific adenine glycosylase [Candidatus Dependentiae bacterium]